MVYHKVYHIVLWCTHLGNVIFIKASLKTNPRLGFKVSHFLNHFQHICHLFNGHHLLIPKAHAQVSNTLNGGLDVGLLICLHIDITFDMLRGHD